MKGFYKKFLVFLVAVVILANAGDTVPSKAISISPGEHFNLTIGEDYHINFTSSTPDKDLEQAHLHPVAYFQFNISQKITGEDVIILVKGREDLTHSPFMYFSKVDTQPSAEQMESGTTISCGLMGMDMCTIPQQSLQAQTKYYVGVFCITSCEFDIKVIYHKQKFLRLGDKKILQFKKGEPGVEEVRIFVPDDSNLTHIIIEAYLLNENQVSSPYHIFINKGNTPPSAQEFHYSPEEIWFQGQGVLIDKEKQGSNWQTGINYTLLVEAPEKAMIIVGSEGFSNHRTMKLNQVVHDMLGAGEFRIFQLEIPAGQLQNDKSSEALSFDLMPYYGNPDLYVNPDIQLSSILDYKWQSIETPGIQSLSITQSDRISANATNTLFYVAVYSQSPATFTLIAYSGDADIRELSFGCTESGYMGKGDIINYQLYVYGLNDTNITITASALTGSLDLYVKRCVLKNETEPISANSCRVTEADIKGHSSESTDNFMFSEMIGTNDKIIIPYNSSTCFSDSISSSKCIYVVGVYGTSDQETNYKLTSRHPYTNVLLNENESHEGFLEIYEQDYFQFTVLNDTQIERVEITVTTLLGSVDVFSSKTYQFPDSNNNEAGGFLAEDEIIYTKKDGVSLKGNYYIGVYARSFAQYVISVQLYRQKSVIDGKNSTDDGFIVGSVKKLNIGKANFGKLKYLMTHQYQFEPENSNMTIVNLFIYYQQYNSTDDRKVKNFESPFVMITGKNKKGESKLVTPHQNYTGMDFFALEFSTKLPGQQDVAESFMIDIMHVNTNQSDVYYKYSVVVNSADIMFVIPEAGYIGEIDERTPDADLFEIYLVQKSKFYLEIFECIGEVEVKASDKREFIENGTYNVEPSQPPQNQNHHVLMTFDHQHEGPFYFAVKVQKSDSIKHNHNQETLYMIIPHIIRNGYQTPHQTFYASSELTVFINSTAPGGYMPTVSFNSLACENNCENSPYFPSTIIYILHITNQKNLLDYFGQCNLDVEDFNELRIHDNKNRVQHVKYYQVENIKDKSNPQAQVPQDHFQHLQNYTINVNSLQGDGPFYAQLMAVAFIDTDTEYSTQDPFTFLYDVKEFNLPNNPQIDPFKQEPVDGHRKQREIMFTLMIGFAILFCLCFAVFLIYKQCCAPVLALPNERPATSIELGENKKQDNKAVELNLNDEIVDVAEKYQQNVDHIQFFDQN